MRWEDYLVTVIDDLEMQAEGLYLADREGTVVDLSLAGYSEVDLAARLQGALGAEVRLGMPGEVEVRGRVRRAGRGWVLLETGNGPVVLLTTHLQTASGLPDGAVAGPARPLTAGLTVSTALRALVEDGRPCVFRLVEGRRLDGVPLRVGADFIVVALPSGDVLVPLAALLVVQEAR